MEAVTVGGVDKMVEDGVGKWPEKPGKLPGHPARKSRS